MKNISLSPMAIHEQEFRVVGTFVKGYEMDEVNAFLDVIVEDYKVFIATIKSLQEQLDELNQALIGNGNTTSVEQLNYRVTQLEREMSQLKSR
ncbi:hypothetical protein JCM10914A_19020 [Paenibacillus sp. JCM 10914]|uniref:DivIVA domain-containing protein n=1 Tax=Paenibacillus sp. JCM 10914 TaxID=1236974 RepID=UPI0003CC4F37|nr:DivIVA domain-containing protein [Paenibacillus sp. JCM 10914]GAE06221.1 hypothetical protein JCM10914_2368 [Paenibacillus sp. JCM 10914]